MPTNKVFLSLDVDLDGIPQDQTAVDASAMATAVSAAPAGVSYVTCGTGGNVPVGDLPISDFSPGNLSLGSNSILCREIDIANNLSGGPDCVTRLDGAVSAMNGISVSGPHGVSSNDGGKTFYFRRQDGASYENLLRAEDGTITIQAEDDVHLKSNTGEDFARFNENAAVWLYYDNSKKIETADSGAIVNGGVSATSVSSTSLTVNSCPIPNPVCYAQMDGDGTAASTETKFGAGVTPATVTDSSNEITWDNTNKTFDIAAAGTYHVLATLVFNVAATTLPTIKIKNGSTAKNTYTAHGIHSAEDPEEITIQAAFTCAASDEISVTFDDDGATNVNLMAGSAVTVKRLF